MKYRSPFWNLFIWGVCFLSWSQSQAVPQKKKTPPVKPKVSDSSPQVSPLKPTEVIYAHGSSLWVQKLDGSTPTEEKLPAAFPDNAKIEFLSASRDGQTWAWSIKNDVYFYHPKIQRLTKVVPVNGESYIYPSISPDGKSVSCRHYAAGGTLNLLDEEGNVHDFGAATKDATMSHFSRDGKTIYFADGPNLYRIAASGGDSTLLVHGRYIQDFDVRDDGTIVAAMPWSDSVVNLGTVSLSGEITKLGVDGNNFYLPKWSLSGEMVAYAVRIRYGGDSDAQGVYVVSLRDLKPKLLSPAASNDESGFIWR